MEMGGCTLWLTGLPGAGKTTLAHELAAELVRAGATVDVLDGDSVRKVLSRDLGYTRDDRDQNIERIAWVAARLARAGAVAIVAAVSPYAAARQRARELTESHGSCFIEVWVNTPAEVCQQRDPKGLYARSRAGELTGLTGVDDPYEAPPAPDIEIDTQDATPAETAAVILGAIEQIRAARRA